MKRSKEQLRLAIRRYVVRDNHVEVEVQAATPASAKYELFKRLRTAGYCRNFQEYLQRSPIARELKRKP